eukprot:CAMPEP_0180629804 /NCGR_PEP_ID=MMETSP1037_2-20121125/39653_1 /TAXON_ID=632150 /ORGANISM="Azadinium spinosum, Strain 3D9" /LENGTH=173 /DNA_ID=CAMNT_0022650623 /DNA_START=69 /DNA_END=587 /DNA_ORIENTATION=-
MAPIDHITGDAVPRNPTLRSDGTKLNYRANVLREELAPYDISSYAYDGAYRFRAEEMEDDQNLDPGVHHLWLVERFQEDADMAQQDDGTYLCTIILGDTRFETFFLCLDQNRKIRIYPTINEASQMIHIEGPDDKGEERRWLLDGRDEEIPSGTVYQIRFAWRKERMLINWEA